MRRDIGVGGRGLGVLVKLFACEIDRKLDIRPINRLIRSGKGRTTWREVPQMHNWDRMYCVCHDQYCIYVCRDQVIGVVKHSDGTLL